jgi:hypothetical protein
MLSTNGLHRGFITHGRYSHEVYSASSVLLSPMLVYIIVDNAITTIYGSASAKYSVDTHEYGLLPEFLCIIFYARVYYI